MSKPFYIDWNAKDALDGMNQLSDLEELAYRRIIDMIYVTDDKLLDDDDVLAWSTKTGKKWKAIKKKLISLDKIEVVDNFISNKKCREKLAESKARIEQSRRAGIASAESRRQLNLLNPPSTDVDTPVATPDSTGVPTGGATNYQLPNTKVSKTPSSFPEESREEKVGVGVLKNGSLGSGGCGYDIIKNLSDDGLADARRSAPGWDIYFLAGIYNKGVPIRGVPHHPNKAFPEWCKCYTKGKTP